MENKKKILILTSRLPYPPIGGDRLRSFNIINILNKYFELHLISLEDQPVSINNKDALEYLSKTFKSFKIFNFPKIVFIANSFFKLKKREPLQVNYYHFKKVQNYIDFLIKKEKIDIVFCFLIRMAKYIKKKTLLKIIDFTDSFFVSYLNSIENTESKFWKPIYKFETPRLFKFEKECVQSFNASLFVNFFEANFYSKYGNTLWVPNGVNEDLLTYKKTNEFFKNDFIAFFGKLSYQPNIDAISWFLNKVFPLLNTNIKLIIIGPNPPKKLFKLQKKYPNRIFITGFLKDPYEIINSSFAVIAPILTGGGMQNKVLEAMALGKIVVTTTLAGKAIVGAKNGFHLFMEDNPQQMAFLLNYIYTHKKNLKNIERNAKSLIENFYTWAKVEKKLLSLFNRLKIL